MEMDMEMDMIQDIINSPLLLVFFVIQCIACYFIGNINPAILISKAYGVDVRNEGSGNAGTTNVMRTIGKEAGILTFLIDVIKGYLTCIVMTVIYDLFLTMVIEKNKYNFTVFECISDCLDSLANSHYYVSLLLIFGLFVIIGHMWPVVFKFKGGKGVATCFGVFLAFDWLVALILIGIVLLAALITKRVSVAVLIACIFATPLEFFLYSLWDGFYFCTRIDFLLPIFLFSIIIALIIFKHIPNIKRIFKGEEPKMSFGSKDKQKANNG